MYHYREFAWYITGIEHHIRHHASSCRHFQCPTTDAIRIVRLCINCQDFWRTWQSMNFAEEKIILCESRWIVVATSRINFKIKLVRSFLFPRSDYTVGSSLWQLPLKYLKNGRMGTLDCLTLAVYYDLWWSLLMLKSETFSDSKLIAGITVGILIEYWEHKSLLNSFENGRVASGKPFLVPLSLLWRMPETKKISYIKLI